MTVRGVPAVVAAVLAVAGALYAWRAFHYGVGTPSAPGPGLLPLVAGVGLVCTAGLLAVRRRGEESAAARDAGGGTDLAADLDAVGLAERETGARLPPAAALLAAAAVCAFVVWQSRVIGLLPAASVAAAASAYLMRARWWTALLTGLGFFVVAYLLFERWLQVPLPHGYLGQF